MQSDKKEATVNVLMGLQIIARISLITGIVAAVVVWVAGSSFTKPDPTGILLGFLFIFCGVGLFELLAAVRAIVGLLSDISDGIEKLATNPADTRKAGPA